MQWISYDTSSSFLRAHHAILVEIAGEECGGGMTHGWISGKDREWIKIMSAKSLSAAANPISCTRREQTLVYLQDSL